MAEELKAASEIPEEMMLTTLDNPYSPKTEYDKWREWDVENGYNTEEYLARVADVPDDIDLGNDWVVNDLTNQAVRSILDNDIIGMYRLV